MENDKIFSFTDFMNKKNQMCNFYNVDRPANFCLADCPMMVKGECTCNTCNKFMLGNPEKAEDIINNWTKPSVFEKLPMGSIILVKENDNDDTYYLRQFIKYTPSTRLVKYVADGNILNNNGSNTCRVKHNYVNEDLCAIIDMHNIN